MPRPRRRLLIPALVLATVLLVLFAPSSKSGPVGSVDSLSPSSYGKNIQNLIAGAENNGRLWQAWTEDSKLYDYLFKDSKKERVQSEISAEGKAPVAQIKSEVSMKEFVREVFDQLFALAPKNDDFKHYYNKKQDGEIEKIPTSGMDKVDKDVFSISYLRSYMKIPSDMVEDMRRKHSQFVSYLKSLTVSKNFYKPGSSGIVYVGGGKFTWFALLLIRNVRKTGSNLPIELFIPNEDEYEYVVCEEILPKMNAKCVLMYEYLKDDETATKEVFAGHEFKGFTYKSLALLLSSFENILLLDADNVPYFNPDTLFINEPYSSSKFVVWPDYWQRSTSPYFYDIAEIDFAALNPEYSATELDEQVLHNLKGAIPNPSTESGQLMILKSAHWDVLLLSLYYNVYGPNHYYHLFSQGAAGQGDKETFLGAATVLNLTFYQVTLKVSAIGYFKVEGGDYRGTAQGQKSPMEDYQLKKLRENYAQYLKEGNEPSGDSEINAVLKKLTLGQEDLTDQDEALLTQYTGIKLPQVFFIHESTPKLDPISLIHNKEFINDEKENLATGKQERIRFYGNYITKKGHYKFEKLQMEYIYDFLCDRKLIIRFIEEQIQSLYLDKGEVFDKEQFCLSLKEQIDWLDGLKFE